MRILTDTNIIVSAILFPDSTVAHVLAYIIEHHHLIISDYSIEELTTVFHRKFTENINALQNFLSCLDCEIAETKPSNIEIPSIRDKTDLPILTTALTANVDILLTGDKDFTTISLDKPKIMNPGTFMQSLLISGIKRR